MSETSDEATELHDEMARAKKSILSLRDDWDGEGSPGFKEEIWNLAANIVSGIDAEYHKVYDGNMPIPSILPVGDGSIDIRWQNERNKLIINVPPETAEPPSFYGKDEYGDELEDTLEGHKMIRVIMSWLKKTMKDHQPESVQEAV